MQQWKIRLLSDASHVLSKEQKDEECDAKDDDSSTEAGNKNVFI